jgi:hypothetical protein
MFPGRQRVLYGLMPEYAKGVVDARNPIVHLCSSVLHYPLSWLCEPLGHHYCGEIGIARFPFLDYQYCGSKVWSLSSSFSHIPSGHQ